MFVFTAYLCVCMCARARACLCMFCVNMLWLQFIKIGLLISPCS
uniref:Uncharacterized protein n=1 Tax=Rhizophora mucronata TaxID=61149 RepID=A0A2P2JL54_RHIMU